MADGVDTPGRPGPAGEDDGGDARPAGRRRPDAARLRAVAAWALAAPPALWLAVRLSGLGAGTWIETFVVFTPYVALASAVGLAVVAALRVRGALVTTGVCCLGYALVMAPLFVSGPRPAEAPSGPALRVMTVNVHYGGADPDRVLQLVDRHDVDLLGVQELTPSFHERLLAGGLGDTLPHRVVDARAGAAGTGLYSRHPVTRLDHEVAGHHANPSARVRVPGATRVDVTVVHPAPPVGGAGRADWRSTFRTLPRPDGDDAVATMLIGDFNATLDQPTMRALLADGYTDAADATGRAWLPTWRSRLPLALAIDHVLVDRSIAADDLSVHGVEGSDHDAVLAHLRLPGPSAN